ncbi:hypothetical protein BGY98DRAFT_249483 [Russula aff. rugulosa BPL654]|nr:hypothetical protein BGY98DRAFT_249483 [Russula aff. rugulosa BPL654]
MSRQRRAVKNLNNPPNEAVRLNGSAGGAAAQHHHHPDDGPQVASRMSVAGSLLDYSFMLFLVIGGCCSESNVWAYEELLRAEPNVGAYESSIHLCCNNPLLCWVP